MKLNWTHISDFGPRAWNRDDGLPKMPFSIDHHEEEEPELILHHHETRLHPQHRIHKHNPKQ